MRIFSATRPSGKLHIGNYLGAVKQWTELQKDNEVIFSIVDYHAITTPWEKDKLGDNVIEVATDYMAAGIDPDRSTIMLQSGIPEHIELSWIFSSMTPVSWFEGIPTFKEKIASNPEYVSLGLMSYPSLMAADILLYNTTHVPVGEDQLPHIELTNKIAKRFNGRFSETFNEVSPILSKGARIMSLKNPLNKMSKTGDETIALSDNPDTIREKIKGAVTDSGSTIEYQEDRPAIANLLTIYSEFSGKEIKDIEKEYAGKGYGDFKKDLAEVIIESLKDFRDKKENLMNNKDHVLNILKKGTNASREEAQKTLQKVKENIGIISL